MAKKIISALLIAILTLTFIVALGEQPDELIPSPEQIAEIEPDEIVTEKKEPAEGLVIKLVLPNEESNEKVLEDMQATIEEQPIIYYFGEETVDSAEELFEGTEKDDYILVEFWDGMVWSNVELPKEAEATFDFEVEYTDDRQLVGFVGIIGEEGIEWTPVKAVAVDGKVVVTFPRELLEIMMDNYNHVVFVLLQENKQ